MQLRRYAFISILVLAAALRMVEVVRRPLDVDEALSLTIAAQSIDRELAFLRLDVHPPLLFLALHALYVLHVPIMAIRVGMVLLSVGSIALLMLIVKRWASEQAALMAGACSALMPSLIYYDGWIRMYTPYQFLELAAFYVISELSGDLGGKGRRIGLCFGWVAANAAALYTHYLAWFAFAAQVCFAATRSVRFLSATAVGAVATALVWLPQLPTFSAQLATGGLAHGAYATDLGATIFQLPSQATVDPHVEGWPAVLLGAVVLLWALLALATAWSRLRSTILPWLAVPSILTIAASLLAHKLLYDDHYHLLFAYALSAWTGVSIGSLATARSRVRYVGAALLGLLLAGGGLYSADASFYTSDWLAVANSIREIGKPEDLIVFEQGAGYWAYQYYEGSTPKHVLQVSSQADIDAAIGEIDRYPRVWLIGSSLRGIDPSLRLLGHIEKGYRLTYFDESTRALPSENVEIGLFTRR